jgi:adenylate cyclase class IV
MDDATRMNAPEARPSDPFAGGDGRPLPQVERRLARNVELKFKVHDLASIRLRARQLATADLGVERQVDTYFFCRTGRLKLREIDGKPAVLIWYQRSDSCAPRPSDYCLIPVSEPVGLKLALAGALGTARVVAKHREILLWTNVRIHLDSVESLGDHVELEAVLDEGRPVGEGAVQVDWLVTRLRLDSCLRLPGSYGDEPGSIALSNGLAVDRLSVRSVPEVPPA